MFVRPLTLVLAVVALFTATGARSSSSEFGAPYVARGTRGAVATDQALATRTGIDVLRAGGNAVDAAVAIGYALAATYPAAGNVGGGGFMLIRFADGRTHFIDFRETAPAAATASMYLDAKGDPITDASIVGPRSAGVPGTVAGLEYARAKYGTMSRAALIAPAIRYADGFTLTAADAESIGWSRDLLAQFPASASVFLRDGRVPRAGDVLRQPDLARTLRAIAARGAAGFYAGDVAKRLSAEIRAGGGIITTADLANYRPVERTPITCARGGDTIVTSPPPSSGGLVICDVLGIVGEPAAGSLRDVANAHLEIEAERRAFAERNADLGDPDFVADPVARFLDPARQARERASISPDRATPSSSISGFASHEGHNTTNYAVIDAAGDAVDVTYTLNNGFGSGFVAGDTGVLMNDEMDDFTTAPGRPNMFGLVQGKADAIAPHKRPLSSMSPTVVADASGRVVLAAGAAGGPRIITTTLDIVRAVVDFHHGVAAAVAQPRVHMQWLPDQVSAEPGAFDARTLARLEAMGYHVHLGRADSIANAAGIAPDGTREAAHETRNATGSALAY